MENTIQSNQNQDEVNIETRVYIFGAGGTRSSYPNRDEYKKFDTRREYNTIPLASEPFYISELNRGAPLTNELLNASLNLGPRPSTILEESKEMLEKYIEDYFGGDLKNTDIVELLSTLDWQISNTKSNTFWDQTKFWQAKDAAIVLISKLLENRLGRNIEELDEQLAKYLVTLAKNGKNIVIVNINYDLAIDNAILRELNEICNDLGFGDIVYPYYGSWYQIRIGLDSNRRRTAYFFSDQPAKLNISKFQECGVEFQGNITILKPHGSLNMFRCNKCHNAFVNHIDEGYGKSAHRIPIFDELKPKCELFMNGNVKCDGKLVHSVITPTLLKSGYLENDYYEKIWNQIYKELERAVKIRIIGYSIPKHDIEIRSMIRSALNSDKDLERDILIIDGSPEIAPWDNEIERDDYLIKLKRNFQTKIDHYADIFGQHLIGSLNNNPLSFWPFGFYKFFTRYVSKHRNGEELYRSRLDVDF